MRLARILLALSALTPIAALGQGAPTFTGQSAAGFQLNTLYTAAQMNAAFQQYANTLNGTLTTPTINGGTITGAAIPGVVGYVASNAALKALPTSFFPTVVRQGFTTAGDGGTAKYIYSASACSLNVGAGDNGSQVRPTSGAGCWIADFTGAQPTPVVWGAIGNGTSDDTGPFQAAATALAGHTLYLGQFNYGISSTVTVPDNEIIQGNGIQVGTGFRQIMNANIIVLQLGNGDTLRDFYASSALPGSGASALIAWNANNTTVEHGYIQAPSCIGIDASGSIVVVDRVYINITQGAGCGGVRIGHATTNGATIDPRVTNVTVASYNANPADYGLLVEDAGGLFNTADDFLFSKYGTKLLPGGSGITNQAINWSTLTGTYLGDTNTMGALLIDTGNASASVRGTNVNSGWASNSAGDGVTISNTGGGTVQGSHFTAQRAYVNANNAFTVNAGTDMTIDGSYLCGNPGTGVFFASGVGVGAVRGTHIGTCDGFTGATSQAIGFAGSNDQMTVTGDDFTGSTLPIGGTTPTGNSVVANNIPLDNAIIPISSGSSVALSGYSNYLVTGTTQITTLTGGWNSRHVTLIPSGAGLTFGTGGNILNAYSAAAGVQIDAFFDDTYWHLK